MSCLKKTLWIRYRRVALGLFVGLGTLSIVFFFVRWKRGDFAIIPL